jgi:UDP-hydrolysing UDP-N-acetyl-D-glucosamine 2-epimerase
MPGRTAVGVVTTSRADYGIYRPVLRALAADPAFHPRLFVAGMHMSPEFGLTVRSIESDPFEIADRIESLISSDSEEGVASSMGLTTMRFAASLARSRPDLLMVMGDRYEMHAAALAAVPLRLPIVHIHGGEETENAVDNVFRHSLTKLSHLHFAATELARRRILAMGEAPNRVIVSGAPSLDNVQSEEILSLEVLAERFGLPVEPFVLVTLHPETLDPDASRQTLQLVWAGLQDQRAPVVFTGANADAAGRALNQAIAALAAAHPERVRLAGTLGTQGYFSAMRHALAMIGNSSSGIIEAASFGLPVLNIGDRQKGREQSANTHNVATSAEAIAGGIEVILSEAFRETARTARNVYGDGLAAGRIVAGLKDFVASGAAVAKRFHLQAERP